MKQRTIIFLMCCMVGSATFAQSTTATLAGKVSDSAGQPLSYSTLSLYTLKNAVKPIKILVTLADGSFRITADTGAYHLVVSRTGFLDLKKQVTLLPGENNIGVITLYPSSGKLADVTVTAVKPLVEVSNDRIIYNAATDPSNLSGSVEDILRKTPMITVDASGNVQMNGQSSFKVLLDGRETAMFASGLKDALKAFPGAMVARVEVITSPSAKYDAEGIGGIINIITKKKLIGYNGFVNSAISTIGTMRNSFSLNMKKNKLGFTGFIASNGPLQHIKGTSHSETVPVSPSLFAKRSFDGNRLTRNTSLFGNLEIVWDIDSLQTMVVYGGYSQFKSHNLSDQLVTTDFDAQPSLLGSYFSDETIGNPSVNLGADFLRRYAKKERELSIRLNGQFTNNDGFTNTVQSGAGGSRYVSNISQSRNREYTVQADFIEPISAGVKLETGVKLIIRTAGSAFQNLVKYKESDAYLSSPFNTDQLDYRQEVYSAYGSLNLALGKTNLRLGLRAEQTQVNGDFISSKTVVSQKYINLVPNFLLVSRFNKVYSLTASYNMRLQRPYIGSLNPFISNNDSLRISYGNPELGPQLIHSLSVQNRIVKGKMFAALSLNASYTGNMVAPVINFNPSSGVTAYTSDNVGQEWQLSEGFSMNTSLGSKWTIGLNQVLRYNTIENRDNLAFRNQGISGNLSVNFVYRATSLSTISGNGGFSRAPWALTSTPNTQVNYQLGFAWKLLNNKLNATINFNNFLAKDFPFRTITQTPDFRTATVARNPYRVIFFGLSYNFGTLKENVSKKKGVANDDLL